LSSSNSSIFKGFILVGFYLVLAKLAAAGKEMVVAWRYGISDTVDAYVFVFNLIQWPAAVIGGVLAGLIVPIAATLKITNPQGLRDLRAVSFGFIGLVGLCLAFLLWSTLPWLLNQPFIGLSSGQIAAANQMRSLVCTLPLSLLASLFAAWTLAANRHLNTLAELLPPLGILLAVLYVGGIMPLIIGTIIGLTIQVIMLGISLLWHGEIEFPSICFKSCERKLLLGSIGVMIVGQTLMSGVAIVDQFMAARLEPGSLATLGYANRIVGLFLALGSTLVARTVLPVFSTKYASGICYYHGFVMRWAWIALGGGAILAATGAASAGWLVKILFERGRFGYNDTAMVADAVRYGFLQLPFFLCSTVLVHALLGAHRRILLIPLGCLALVIKLVLLLFLLPMLGIKAILISSAAVYLATSFVMMIIIHRTGTTVGQTI
jgi:peptidoglycan biosynthesis protein MviN/MurJ (putative lipid II flippase)